MKKILVLVLALSMMLGLLLPAMAEEAPKYKIAIMTGTVTQGEEEFRAAEMLKEKYPDIVITDTYPDRFSSEVETTVGKILQFASDPDVKAIIVVQAVQGTAAAFTQIRNDLKRDDLLLIAGVPAEDPQTITSAADYVMGVDEINGGKQIVQTANDWGADVLVHEATGDGPGHSSAAGAARVAREAGVGRLVLVHLGPQPDGGEALLAEARAVFPATELGHDGARYEF